MKCPEVQELLSAYYDGELAEDEQSHVSEHLGECSQCASQIAGFRSLSTITETLAVTTPPERIWHELEEQLDQDLPSPQSDRQSRVPISRRFGLAAAILIALGIGWYSYQHWSAHDHDQFAAEFGHYLEEFKRDPHAAQEILLANYQSEAVDADQAIQQVGYRPAVADGLPSGYRAVSTHLIKMPCCDCVQTLCRRDDGTTLAIFEHDDEETTEWFGDRPEITARCNDRQCCLVELDDQIAASWKRGKRHITLIGVRDLAEVERMVARLGVSKAPVPN